MENRKSKIIKIILFILPMALLFGGCQEKSKIKKTRQKPGIAGQKVVVEDTNSARKLAAENKQLKEQINTLLGLGKPARAEALSTLNAIEITNRSNLYDKNNDKKKETLVVYMRPIDDMGDVVKAAGAVVVQLWDLNADPNEALLAAWRIEPKDLKKSWSGSLLTSYYKLQFNAGAILKGKEKDLTLKAEFTDYLTGKVLKAQRVINSR